MAESRVHETVPSGGRDSNIPRPHPEGSNSKTTNPTMATKVHREDECVGNRVCSGVPPAFQSRPNDYDEKLPTGKAYRDAGACLRYLDLLPKTGVQFGGPVEMTWEDRDVIEPLEPVQAIIVLASRWRMTISHEFHQSGPDNMPRFVHQFRLSKNGMSHLGYAEGDTKREAKERAHRAFKMGVLRWLDENPHAPARADPAPADDLLAQIQELAQCAMDLALRLRRLERKILKEDDPPQYEPDLHARVLGGSFNPYGNGQRCGHDQYLADHPIDVAFEYITTSFLALVIFFMLLFPAADAQTPAPHFLTGFHFSCTTTQTDHDLGSATVSSTLFGPGKLLVSTLGIAGPTEIRIGLQQYVISGTPNTLPSGTVFTPEANWMTGGWIHSADQQVSIYELSLPAFEWTLGYTLSISCISTGGGAFIGATVLTSQWAFGQPVVVLETVNTSILPSGVGTDTPMWVSEIKPSDVVDLWDLDREERNRQQHALNGNSSSADFQGTISRESFLQRAPILSNAAKEFVAAVKAKASVPHRTPGGKRPVEPKPVKPVTDEDKPLALRTPTAEELEIKEYSAETVLLRQNPYYLLTDEKLMDEFRRVRDGLPRASGMYFATIVDEDEVYTCEGDVWSEAPVTSPKTRDRKKKDKPASVMQVNPDDAPEQVHTVEVPEGAKDHRKLMDRYKHIAYRKASQFTNWGKAIDWACGGDHVPKALMMLVLQECRKTDWGQKHCCDQAVFRSLAHDQTKYAILMALCDYSPELNLLVQAPVFQKWASERFPTLSDIRQKPRVAAVVTVDTSDEIKPGFNQYGNEQRSYDAYLQASRNKRQHALNGNQDWDFPGSMSDILAFGTVRPLIEADGQVAGPLFDAVDAVARHTGLLGPQGVITSNVPRETALRGASVNILNAVDLTNDLDAPEALLTPVTVRDGETGELENANERPYLFGIGLLRRSALGGLVPTPHGLSVAAITAKSGNIRPDQISELGFKTQDIAMLMRVEPQSNGDSMQAPYLKLQLYAMIHGWQVDPRLLPLGSQPGKFDSYTRLDPNPVVGFGYNVDGPWGIDCGGAAVPVFPYVDPAVVPTIAFHVSTATVPSGQPWLMIPPGLLYQGHGGEDAINMFMLALAFAPFPCGMHQVTVSTLDENDLHAGNQQFISHASQIHIPGLSTINIVLPVRTSAAPPGNLAAANDQALTRPQCGPTAYGAFAADALLDVNWSTVPANYIQYNLAAYLGTWMAQPNSPLSTTMITVFLKQLAQLTCRTQDLRYVWELACTLTCRYPTMQVQAEEDLFRLPSQAAQDVWHHNYFCLKPHQMTADFPQFMELYDTYVADTNLMWYNKIVSGAYIPVPDNGPPVETNYDFDASPRLWQYAMHQTRCYAITAEHIFTYFGQCVEVWNDVFTRQNYVGLLDELRGFFAAYQGPGGGPSQAAIVSELGTAAAILHCRVNGSKPAEDMYGYTIWHYINVPCEEFDSAYDQNISIMSRITPCVLADIWVQLNLAAPSRAFSPMLSSNKLLTGISLPDGCILPIAGNGWTTGIPNDCVGPAVSIDAIPLINDDQLFNQRLIWHTFNAGLYTLQGNVNVANVPGNTNMVMQKGTITDWTVPNLITGSILRANTRWMPYMTPDGLRLNVAVTGANGASLMTQILSAKTTTGVPCWLVRKAKAMPQAIITGTGNKQSRLKRYPRVTKNSSSSSGPASKAAEEAATAPES